MLDGRQENSAELRILRRTSGVTREDWIRNTRVRGITEVMSRGEYYREQTQVVWLCYEKRKFVSGIRTVVETNVKKEEEEEDDRRRIG